jgi:hypothetical protein
MFSPHPQPRLSLAWLSALFLAVFANSACAQVVINEIYYDPPNNTTPTEFLELFNAGASAVDLSGWKMDAGVSFVFPSGSTIAAGGYLVLAQDAAAFQTAFGFAPFGVFTGKLSNSGEQVRLRNAANATVDEVTYGEGFPWPTAVRGLGSSMELINPALDNSRAGSWRASGQPVQTSEQVFVPRVSTTWHYRKGTSEASDPATAWRALSFVEDSSWLTGQTSVGFGDDDDNTILTDMQNSYSSVYLRRVFTVPAGEIPPSLKLRVRVDDGCVVWINGIEVARLHVPTGTLNYNSFATDHEAGAATFEEVTISNAASVLVEGDNVIAIHALNSTLGGDDFSIDAELVASEVGANTAPTPGAINSAFSSTAPPAIDNVAHSPVSPAGGQAVTVTARVLGASGGSVSSVSLLYQPVSPGSYIRKSDAAYTTNWTSLAMYDDGTNGDALAGDSIYTAVIPASVQTHRQLVRYRISATDSGGNTIRVPYADDAQPNFAYFVSNGLSAWSGAFNPGTTGTQAFSTAFMQTLQCYQLIANITDVRNSQYTSSYDGVRMWGTLVFNGKVYDHIQYHNRGEFSTYACGKNKWRVRFNTARDFEPLDDWGRPYPEKWDTLFLNTAAAPWAAVHRGMCGVEEAVSLRFEELAGVPTPRSHFIQWRVINNASETPSGTQFSGGNPTTTTGGDLWGVYHAIEPVDGSFLDARGLPDGNVYKIESSAGDKKHQGATQPVDNSDSIAFRAASSTTQTEAWWRANMDIPAYCSFQASNRAVGNVDLREGWNHCFYHNPDGHWVPVPWDLDMMFMPKTQQTGVILQKNCVNIAAIGIEYKNRCRELLDLMLAESGTSAGQIGQLIDEYAQMMNPTGQALTWADLDAAMWNKNPRTTYTPSQYNTNHYGNFFKTPYTDTRIGGNWVRTLATSDHEGFMKYLLDYATNTFPTGSTWTVNNGNQLGYGYKYVEADAADALVPNRPAATYTGPAAYPLNDLRFTSGTYSSPPSATFSAIQWRIAEISAPGIPLFDATQPRIYELTDVWRSAEIPSVSGETRIPGGSLKVGHTYRVRLRHKDATGRWSRWSTATQFVVGSAVVEPYQAALVITKLMYNPAGTTTAESNAGYTAQDFEFIELKNIGTETLDLSAVSFTAGVTFSFPAGTTLAPGATILVVKNVDAFNLRYGTGKPVAGSYSGNLDNGGETLTLSLGGSSVIRSFAYSDGSHPASGQSTDPWPTYADGGGYALVLNNPQNLPDPSVATNWRLSALPGGSPGMDDTITYAAWLLGNPGAGPASADSDYDGILNLMEYATGTNPLQPTVTTVAASGGVANLTVSGSTAPYLSYSFRRQIASTDITCHVEFSPDLGTWSEDGVRVSSIPNGDGTATELWRSAQPVGTSLERFVRLRVTQP